jgi:uncharacterized protein YcbK (DUF882 family)
MRLSKDFTSEEFNCHDGTVVPEEFMDNLNLLVDNLQVLRDELKEPIKIVSGYRTPSYNKKIGGATKSQHLLAKAADIVVRSKTPKQLAAIIEKLIAAKKIKQGGLGIYPSWIHYDVRNGKARWQG